MDLLASLWDIIVVFLLAFVFIGSLSALVLVLTDVFRDGKLNVWAKVAWVILLVFIPLLTTLIYLIARGGGIADRVNDQAREARDATDTYIREVAGISAADEIAKAKKLLDEGTITADEFAALKARALAGEQAPAV